MDPLKRLKGHRSASSPRQSDPTTPGTPETPGSSVLEDPGSSNQPLKWYKKVRRINVSKPGHPYELKAISVQTQGEVPITGTCVEFWPYVGPLLTKRKVQDVSWEDWEGCCVIVSSNKLRLGRCRDEDPWELLWELTIPKDELFHVTWTYHPFTLHPLIVTGGQLGLIYIIDAVTKSCFRVLHGHGDEILCLTFHLAAPHILASASSDKTVRIWNILGGEVTPPEPGDKLSENYPMAMADEGNVIVAVLAGEGSGGHRSKVVGVAFHPTHRAIATCGCDYTVKIWPLPPLPDPHPDEPLTPCGYRPKIIHFPLFSTSRMFRDIVDAISWLSDDILVSRSKDVIITWQWLAFRRFFRMGQAEAVYPEPQRTDFNDSHSYMVIARYPIKMPSWYFRPGVHHAFRPTASEQSSMEANPNLVPDILIGIGVDSKLAEIQLFNPSLAKPDAPPEPITELRYESEADSEEDEDSDEEMPLAQIVAKASENVEEAVKQGIQQIKLFVGGLPEPPPAPVDEGTSPKRQHRKSKVEERKKNPSLLPWSLLAKEFSAVWKATKDVQFKNAFRDRAPIVAHVAISPRGAKWIVGVGEAESIFVWRMREGDLGETGEKAKGEKGKT